MENFEYPLFIKIFDADVLGSDEYLGGLNIDINEGKKEGYISIDCKDAKPKWLDLKYGISFNKNFNLSFLKQ